MTLAEDSLFAHLAERATTVCRAWAVTRSDGIAYGFTDHDRDITFDTVVFKASSGMTAGALQQSGGLAVDNSEAIGALSDLAIRETDIVAGRFDGAEVQSWLVNWSDTSQRILQFRGTFGEIQRAAGAFRVELRGLTEALNIPRGNTYQKTCSAVLGDKKCRFDLTTPDYVASGPIIERGKAGTYVLGAVSGRSDGWFERGRISILSGAASGLTSVIKLDRTVAGQRMIEVWSDFPLRPDVGDQVRLEAGCDKLPVTCQTKFNNFLNFRGFPNLPGDEWLTSYPVTSQLNDGGSLSK